MLALRDPESAFQTLAGNEQKLERPNHFLVRSGKVADEALLGYQDVTRLVIDVKTHHGVTTFFGPSLHYFLQRGTGEDVPINMESFIVIISFLTPRNCISALVTQKHFFEKHQVSEKINTRIDDIFDDLSH